MGKSSRQKRRTYQSPKKARSGNNTAWYVAAAVLVIGGVLAVMLSRSPGASGVGPTISDHWHAALGVNDCGTWVPNWSWPPGPTSQGAPSQAGSGGQIYAGLHSHGDGLIHMEPSGSNDTGNEATLGKYFKYGGWKLDETSINFTAPASAGDSESPGTQAVSVVRKNGDKCNGKPGVLRWSVNGKEMHGNPAKYKINQGDVIALVFTTADAKLPPKTAVPSYTALQKQLGDTAPTTTIPPGATTTVAPGATTTTSAAGATTTTSAAGATTTSTP